MLYGIFTYVLFSQFMISAPFQRAIARLMKKRKKHRCHPKQMPQMVGEENPKTTKISLGRPITTVKLALIHSHQPLDRPEHPRALPQVLYRIDHERPSRRFKRPMMLWRIVAVLHLGPRPAPHLHLLLVAPTVIRPPLANGRVAATAIAIGIQNEHYLLMLRDAQRSLPLKLWS